jgi:predicted membrane-bound spermidine synthase
MKSRRLDVAIVSGAIIGLANFLVLILLNTMSPGLLASRWLMVAGYLIALWIGAWLGVAVDSKWRR